MQNNTIYYQSSKDIACICYQNATQSYSTHTRADKITVKRCLKFTPTIQ